MTYTPAKFDIANPTVKEKMHLQENTLFDLDLLVKVTCNVAQYPLHNVTYSATKFEVAMSYHLGGDRFTRRERSGSVVECLT